MSTTGKIAITLLGAGGALGLTGIMESPNGRQVMTNMLEQSGLREALQDATEKFAVALVHSAFGGRSALTSA